MLLKKREDSYLRLKKANLTQFTTYKIVAGQKDIIKEDQDIDLLTLNYYKRKAYKQALHNKTVYVLRKQKTELLQNLYKLLEYRHLGVRIIINKVL